MVVHNSDFDRLYERKSSWTLQEDSQLISQLSAITNRMLDSMRTFDDVTLNLHRDAELLKLRIDNVHNNIHLLKATKLVEETITESPTPHDNEAQRDGAPISCVGAEERTTNAIKIALEKCFRFVDETFSQPESTERFDGVGPSRFQFKDPYANRRLPPIVGSAEFHTADRFGVVGVEPTAQPTAEPSNATDIADDVSRQLEFDASLSARLDDSISLRSADTDPSRRLPSAQSSIGGQPAAVADDSRSLTPSSRSLRVDPRRPSPSSSSNRSERSVEAVVQTPSKPQVAQFRDSLAAALLHRPLIDNVKTSSAASSDPAASPKQEPNSGESDRLSVRPLNAAAIVASTRSPTTIEPTIAITAAFGETTPIFASSASQHLNLGLGVQSKRSVGHGLFSSSSSDEEAPEKSPAAEPATDPQSKSIVVQQRVDNVNEEGEEMSKPKPVLKAFDANFSDRLSATLLRNSGKKTAAGATAPPAKRSDDVVPVPSTAEPIGGLTLPRARHSSRSSVSSNEELGPSSVASRIAQIGNKIPIGARKFESATSEGGPPSDCLSAKEGAGVSGAMPSSTSGRPPPPPSTNSVVMGRARGPTRRAPTNIARLPAAVATSVDTSPQQSVASAAEKAIVKPTSTIVNQPPTSRAASTSTASRTPACSINSDFVGKPPPGAPSATRVVVAPAKKAPKKSIFDSSTSDDDDFLAAPRSTHAVRPTVGMPVAESSPIALNFPQQSQTAAKPVLTAATGPTKAVSTLRKKKGLFDDSDSDV